MIKHCLFIPFAHYAALLKHGNIDTNIIPIWSDSVNVKRLKRGAAPPRFRNCCSSFAIAKNDMNFYIRVLPHILFPVAKLIFRTVSTIRCEVIRTSVISIFKAITVSIGISFCGSLRTAACITSHSTSLKAALPEI